MRVPIQSGLSAGYSRSPMCKRCRGQALYERGTMDSGLCGNDVQDTDCFAVLAMTDGPRILEETVLQKVSGFCYNDMHIYVQR